MRTISQFVTDDPKQLGTQLSKFEQNVVQETSAIRSLYEISAVPTDVSAASGRAAVFTTGQCARADTRAGACTINLVRPANGLPGEFIFVQAVGGNGFVMNGIGCTVNGAASIALTPTAQIVFRFYYDGANYWF